MSNDLQIDSTPEGKEICIATIRFSEDRQGVISIQVDGMPEGMRSKGCIRVDECVNLYQLLSTAFNTAKGQ